MTINKPYDIIILKRKRIYETVVNALSAPIMQIASNAGKDGSVIANEIICGRELGYDALTDTFVDMYDAGIVDPCKAMRTALINSSSVASMLLTTESAIVEKKKEEPSMGMPAGMPNMMFG